MTIYAFKGIINGERGTILFRIIVYSDHKGDSEIKDYLQQLNNVESKENRLRLKKITSYIHALEEKGFALKEPHIKKIDGDIWELRPLNDRFLFASCYKDSIVLLSHFIKKTNKTPRAEINKANILLEDFKERWNKIEKK